MNAENVDGLTTEANITLTRVTDNGVTKTKNGGTGGTKVGHGGNGGNGAAGSEKIVDYSTIMW